MLDLLQPYVGSPEAELHNLVLAKETLTIYGSANTIVILDAHTLTLVRVLAFSQVFTNMPHTTDPVSCMSVDAGMKLIVASIKSRIAVWHLSGNLNEWRVHSSLTIPVDKDVTTLDCKSGLLAVGTGDGLSVYTLTLENDLPTWNLKWMSNVPSPVLSRFSPSLMYIATSSNKDTSVRIYSTTSGQQTQRIPHPRPVTNITWRHSQASSRDDLILYTISSDATLRVFLPVLDAPTQLQLHMSLDLFSSVSFNDALRYSSMAEPGAPASSIFWLHRETVSDALTNAIRDHASREEDAGIRRAREIQEEGWDLFLRVLGDGSVVVTAVTNIDRRPPTLLKQFTLQQSFPNTLPGRPPKYLYVLPGPSPNTSAALISARHPAFEQTMSTHNAPATRHPHISQPASASSSITLLTSPPLASFNLSPLAFFDAHKDGLKPRARSVAHHATSEIKHFVRTPGGRGVGILREEGGETWRIGLPSGSTMPTMLHMQTWQKADIVVILRGGRALATYDAGAGVISLYKAGSSTASASLTIPHVTSLFSLPPTDDGVLVIGITPTLSILRIAVDDSSSPPHLSLQCEASLPLPSPPTSVLPVDPMAWSESKPHSNSSNPHDVLLSISANGDLNFWFPEKEGGWRCTGKVRTGRIGVTLARCSSAKKTVLVVLGPGGQELTIWDSKESEFASGLEYRTVVSSDEEIHDLDWTSTPDRQSILAVGFPHHVDILCQQRMTYFGNSTGWMACHRIDISATMPHPIRDSTWLARGAFLVGSGHQMILFGDQRDSSNSLFEYVARQNGPLPDYHPQLLLQCLLWEKVAVVKQIILNLDADLQREDEGSAHPPTWRSVPLETFSKKDSISATGQNQFKRYTSLFDPNHRKVEEEQGFSRTLVGRLILLLEKDPLPHLTPNEHAHLLVLIQTTLEIDEQRRALDANGLRYLISLRSFYILNERASPDPTPGGVFPLQSGWRARLRYRDMIWAFHSESQDLLLNSSTAACTNGKMTWADARALGVPIWLTSVDALKGHLEVIARNEYMTGEVRDPTACALFYFALGKTKLVHGLWRQAAGHKEQNLMLKFLANDFSQPRWRTAALKNAYALLSKRRFTYAAAFFLLGGSLKDAVNVCIRQLDDFQLAIAIARAVEQSNEGPVLLDILTNTVVPIAFKDGNRWLGSWAFWLLRRKDLAVRILLTPVRDIATEFDARITDIAYTAFDDPSLALLFSQLKSKTLQTAKGTSEISGRTEFNFVQQMARVFCRMGCHVLALDLVRSWSFERPSMLVVKQTPPDSPPLKHRLPGRSSVFGGVQASMRRRSSIMIDMDISAEPGTRPASPTFGAPNTPAQETIKEEGDHLARKTGLGSLMKAAKQDAAPAEFDMGAFGF